MSAEKKGAYIHENVGEDEYLHASKYYYVLKRVPHFENIDDDILKFSISFPAEHCSALLSHLKKRHRVFRHACIKRAR